MKSAQRMVSLLLVLCLLLGNVSITAFAEAVLALPSSMQIIDEEAFYGAKSLDKVVLPASIKEIRSHAFANSSVKTINLPASLTYIANDAFDETPLTTVTAVEGTYAYNWAVDHHYIIPKIPITIQSVKANVTTVEVGTPITWTVNAEGGVAPLSYNYAVFKDGLYQDAFSVSEAEETVFNLTPTTGGYWSVLVTISDAYDTVASEISESVYAIDIASYGNIKLTLTQGLNTYLVGDTIQVVAEKVNTYGTVQYSFTAVDGSDNVLATQNDSSSSSFSFTASATGDITINGTVTDELARSATAQRTIHVYSDEEIKPAAPANIQVNGDILPSESTNSVLYPQRQFRISWDQVSGADIYNLEIKKAEDADTTILASVDGLSELTYTLSPELFASIEQEALIQVAVSAQNRVIGDAAIGYFKVKTLQEQSQIYINGETSAAWNEVYYAAARRDFLVLSDSNWTFTTDQDWIICNRDGDILSVFIKENPSVVDILSGSITINNGLQSAQITITHGYLKKAPQLLTPTLSNDGSAPSEIPYGDIYLKYNENDADTVTAKLYKRDGSDYVYVSEASSKKNNITLSIPNSIQPSDQCMLELIGYTSEAYSTGDKSSSKTTVRYYLVFSNNDHFALIEGQNNCSVNIFTKETIHVHASTVWSYTIDCDWLTLSTDLIPDESCVIHAEPNLGSVQRIGHITITSGTASAIITVIQDTFIPYISYPSGLSQTESSPTSIAYNDFSFIYQASSMEFVKISDGSMPDCISSSSIDVSAITVEKANLTANTAYRITVSNAYGSTSYFVKTASSTWNSSYINLSDDTETEKNAIFWNVAAGQQSKQIKLKTNGSWTITSNIDWLNVSSSSGSSSTSGKTITVDIQENTTGNSRCGTVVFKRATNAEAVLYVEQAASDYIVVMNTDTLVPYKNNDTIRHVSGQEDYFQVEVIAGYEWSVVSDSSWLTFDSSNSTTKTVTSTHTKLKLYCAENSVGSQPRSAKLTFSSGNASFVLIVSQDACLEVPTVATSITSTNINNPSIVLYQDISFTWTSVPGAIKYDVSLMLPSSAYQQHYYIDEDGSSEYSFTIPHDWLAVDGNAYFFRVKSIDQQGYEYSGSRYCYTVVYDERAALNGKLTPSWENATDYQATKNYTVMSTASWTAAPQQSWIHVTPMTGESGDTLTVILDNNTGATRNGTVNVTVNGNTTTLYVYQCAKLTDNPTVISPTFSTEPESPSIVAASDVSPLTVTWEVELQTDFYYLAIYGYEDKGFSNHVVETRNIKPEQAGNYTFDNIQLENDKLYMLKLARYVAGRGMSYTYTYFIPQSGLSSVSLGRTSSLYPEEARLWGQEDHEWFTINSSGTWIAETNSGWIMVAKESLDQEDLDEYGKDPSYFDKVIGQPGTSLHISALANHTGAPRYGNVTVTCGSASLTIPVSQDINITTAKILKPTLGTYKNPAKIPYRALNLSWSAGGGGTGSYHLVLREREPGNRAWNTILETASTTSKTYTIPQNKLTEGYDYLLRLVTEADNGDSDWETYYFNAAYENELTLALSLNTDYAFVNGKVNVSAAASGGAGGYQYEFELLKEGTSVHTSELDLANSRAFALSEAGNYQIRVTVVDALDYQLTAYTSLFSVVEDTQNIVSYDTITPAGENDDWIDYPTMDDEGLIAYHTIGQNEQTAYHTIGGSSVEVPHPTLTDTEEDNYGNIIDDSDLDFDDLPFEQPNPTYSERASDSFYFTMSASEVAVNKAIRFRVYAPNAEQVCLIVDNKAYETYDVEDGYVSFKRAFSTSGERKIAFARIIDGSLYDQCGERTLSVTASNGKLAIPQIDAISDSLISEDITIAWHAVENAQIYKFILSKNDKQVIEPFIADRSDSYEAGTRLEIIIPAGTLKEPGEYVAYFMAIAEGYEVSDNSSTFTVIDANAEISISYPYENASYDIGSTMHTTINANSTQLHCRLLVTNPVGETKAYFPDNNGVCYPIAEIAGEYTLTAQASYDPDFNDPYEKTIHVSVNRPAVTSVLDYEWQQPYGVVFTQNSITIQARTNCSGIVEYFIDRINKGTLEPDKNDPYLYNVTIGSLAEGKHTVGFKVTYNNGLTTYSSNTKSIDVYSVTALEPAQQITQYSVEETLFEYYPDSVKTKKIAFASPVTLLGTYGTNYVYIKYGTLYGFAENGMFQNWSVIQAIEDERIQEQTRMTSETEFRSWAADIIQQYYNEYCMFDKGYGESYQNITFKNLRAFWNFLAGHSFTDVGVSQGQFDGLYREYYFMALYKRHYDFNDTKSTFYTVKYDSESEEEYKARVMPFYKMLLIETMKEKGAIEDSAFGNTGKASRGLYKLEYDASSGKMIMKKDENGVMGTLEKMADTEANKAWTHFCVDAIETAVDVAIEYYNAGSLDKAVLMKKKLEETVVQSIGDIIRTFSDTEFDQRLATLENNLYEVLKCEIANSELINYNRIIRYLQNIYDGKDDSYEELYSQKYFKEAVNELIHIAENDKYSHSLNHANKVMAEWFSDGIKLKNVLSQEQVLQICSKELEDQLLNLFLTAIKEVLGYLIEDQTIVVGLTSIFTDTLKVAIHEKIAQEVNDVRSGVITDQLNTSSLIKVGQTIFKDSVALTEKLDKLTKKDGTTKASYELCLVLISKFSSLYSITDKYHGNYNSAFWVEIRDLLIETIGDIVVASWTELISKDTKGKIPPQVKGIIDTLINAKDDILKTSESLAKAANASFNDWSNEKQVSFFAQKVYSAYAASQPILISLKFDLITLRAKGKNQLSLKEIILDSSYASCTEIYDITNRIMMQNELDLIGAKNLVELINLCENSPAKPTFYKHLLTQIKDTAWEGRLTHSIAQIEYNNILKFNKKWISAWKNEYQQFAN